MATEPNRPERMHIDETGDDDDDMDYTPSQDADDQEDQESNPTDDLEGTFGEVEVEVEVEEDGDDDDDEPEDERMARRRRQFIHLVQNTQLARLFALTTDQDDVDNQSDDDVNEDSDRAVGWNPTYRRRRRLAQPLDPNRFPKVPSDAGTELMNSGTFGSSEDGFRSASPNQGFTHKKKLARRLLDRELAIDSCAGRRLNQKLMAQNMLPSTNAEMIVHYDAPVYSGQFSEDGNFFYAVNKDFRVRMYDTSNPWKWRYYKTVDYPFGQWTLTDATLSPDNKYLAYTSIRSTVCLAPTDPNDLGNPYSLDLADLGNGRQMNAGFMSRYDRFGIWSVRFSGDGRQLVAGATSGKIVVYDIESRRTIHRISGHDEDVNAVCFADSSSPHILYSGSDDTYLKVWDTRSMGDSREAGAFVGHIEGITYIDSKGDGRYILSNGKDQSMKLWDLRMVMSPKDFGTIRPDMRRIEAFDYRWGEYDEDLWYRDKNDNSLVTFRGHRILRTLIRCHFSPPGSTNSRYVYSGSADGKVYIWNMDATLAGVIDVYAATKDSRPADSEYNLMGGWGAEDDESQWRTCVRDASWHPNAPMIAASAWNGYGRDTGTVTAHSWNDEAADDEAEPKMGIRLNQTLQTDPSYYQTQQPRMPRRVSRGLRGLRAFVPGAND